MIIIDPSRDQRMKKQMRKAINLNRSLKMLIETLRLMTKDHLETEVTLREVEVIEEEIKKSSTRK